MFADTCKSKHRQRPCPEWYVKNRLYVFLCFYCISVVSVTRHLITNIQRFYIHFIFFGEFSGECVARKRDGKGKGMTRDEDW